MLRVKVLLACLAAAATGGAMLVTPDLSSGLGDICLNDFSLVAISEPGAAFEQHHFAYVDNLGSVVGVRYSLQPGQPFAIHPALQFGISESEIKSEAGKGGLDTEGWQVGPAWKASVDPSKALSLCVSANEALRGQSEGGCSDGAKVTYLLLSEGKEAKRANVVCPGTGTSVDAYAEGLQEVVAIPPDVAAAIRKTY